MKIITNKDFDCYDVAEMSGIKRGINIDGKTLEEIKSEAIKDFAEWLESNEFIKEYNWNEDKYEVISADIITKMYEDDNA